MNVAHDIAPQGDLSMVVHRDGAVLREISPHEAPLLNELSWATVWEYGFPHSGLGREVNAWRLRNVRHVLKGYWRAAFARKLGIPTHIGTLWITKIRQSTGEVTNYGLASARVVTTAGVGFIVDAFQNLTEVENLKFHGYGTGSTAENVADTALITELTTEYNPNSTRPTGTTVEGASANIYRTVATLTPDSGTPVLREHGVFSQAATGGGVLLDRTVFAAITLDSSLGDSLQTTYELTLTAGS